MSQCAFQRTYSLTNNRKYNIEVVAAFDRSTACVYEQIRYLLNNLPLFESDGLNWRFEKMEKIAAATCYSVSTVKRAIRKLVNAGLIIVNRFSNIMNGRVNCYCLPETQKHPRKPAEKLKQVILPPIIKNKEENKYNKRASPLAPAYNPPHKVSNVISKTIVSKLESNKIVELNAKTKMDKEYYDQLRGDYSAWGCMQQHEDDEWDQEVLPKGNYHVVPPKNDVGKTPAQLGDILKEALKGSRDPNVASVVVDIYNKTIVANKEGLQAIRAPRFFEVNVREAMEGPLNNDVEEWQSVCDAVVRSSYLMDVAFDLKLGWLLLPKTIKRIQNRELGCKGYASSLALKVSNARAQEGAQKASKHFADMDESEDKKAARKALFDHVGASDYFAWFAMISIDDNMRIGAPSPFHLRQIETRFGEIVMKVGLWI